MSTLGNPLFETALALPQSERADLAFQLLQSLELPGVAVPAEEFGAELKARVEAHRRGELESLTLEEARAQMQRLLAEGRGH
jgi:putative addiction module component (TIGR02574 family)